MTKKLFIASAVLFLIGLVFGWIQNSYYGYVDAEGILRDSLFLPLSVFSLLLGVILSVIAAGLLAFKKVTQKPS